MSLSLDTSLSLSFRPFSVNRLSKMSLVVDTAEHKMGQESWYHGDFHMGSAGARHGVLDPRMVLCVFVFTIIWQCGSSNTDSIPLPCLFPGLSSLHSPWRSDGFYISILCFALFPPILFDSSDRVSFEPEWSWH